MPLSDGRGLERGMRGFCVVGRRAQPRVSAPRAGADAAARDGPRTLEDLPRRNGGARRGGRESALVRRGRIRALPRVRHPREWVRAVRCQACGDELLIAFSCKGRGFCPSCTSRRMHDTAAHLVNRVIPQVPVRQWVLSLPRWARFLLARDPILITRSLDLALRAIFAQQRRRARRAGALAPRTGAVTFVQRFGGALNLNVHFHCVIPDGVFVRENGSVHFVALAPPSDDEVMAVLRRIVARLDDLLGPRLASAEADARPPDALGAAQAEAMNSLGTAPPDTGRARKLAAYLHGF